MTTTGQPVLRASERIQKRTEAHSSRRVEENAKAVSGKQSCEAGVEVVETNNSRTTTLHTKYGRSPVGTLRMGKKPQGVKTFPGKMSILSLPGTGKKRKARRGFSSSESDSSDSNKSIQAISDDSDSDESDMSVQGDSDRPVRCNFGKAAQSSSDEAARGNSDSEYQEPVTRKRIRPNLKRSLVKVNFKASKELKIKARTLLRNGDSARVRGRKPSAMDPKRTQRIAKKDNAVDVVAIAQSLIDLPKIAKQPLTLMQWIQSVMSGMFHAFMSAREHYNTPLAHIIYWMPRVAPVDGAARHMPSSAMNHWTLPVKDTHQPWELASVSQYLRTDQVAHWLHVSMQDLVGFLTLCSVREVTALNMYLNFRLILMKAIQAMPNCYTWVYNKTRPQPGEHSYELLLKLRSIDDEQQRLLAIAINASIESRRNLSDVAALPRNATVAFDTRIHRAMTDHLQKSWSLYRAITSPVIEWHADAIYPGFDDMRSVERWFKIEDPAMESVTIDSARDVIEADMMFRTVVERDRNAYIMGDMLDDELAHSLHDTRILFPHQLPFKFPKQNQGPARNPDCSGDGDRKQVQRGSLVGSEPPSARTRVRPNFRHESWWAIELDELYQWDYAHNQEDHHPARDLGSKPVCSEKCQQRQHELHQKAGRKQTRA